MMIFLKAGRWITFWNEGNASYVGNKIGSPSASGDKTLYTNYKKGSFDQYEIGDLCQQFEYSDPLKNMGYS